MPRPCIHLPPTYEEATACFWYKETALYRTFKDPINNVVRYNPENLLETWPTTLAINGHPWPFLKVVYLLHHKRWPEGAVSYPREPCKPRLIKDN